MKRQIFALTFILLLAACGPRPGLDYNTTTPQFRDVAADVGIDFQHGAFRWGFSGDAVAMMGGGLCWLDIENDGWLDLYVVNSYAVAEAGRWEAETGSLPRNALYHNDGEQFVDVSAASGADLAVRGNGCVAADFNLDGFTDIYVTTSRFNHLLWNNGDGTFVDGSNAAQIGVYGWQTAANVGDVNEDGLPDLFLAGYVDINNKIEGSTMGFPNTHFGRPDLLFLNRGNDENGYAVFEEVHEQVGLIEFDADSDHEYGLGASLTDVDQDGDLDLFVANDTNPNRLYINDQTATNDVGFRFIELGAKAHIDDINSGMGVATGDFNEDGHSDLFITNLGQQVHSVYSGSNTGVFADVVGTMGVENIGVGWTGWGTAWADFDLDSDLDLFVAHGSVPVVDFSADAMRSHLYENMTAQGEAGVLRDASAETGITALGKHVARGSAVADYDNDGDLDIAVATIGGQLMLLENSGTSGNWLHVQLDGLSAGTVVTATLPDGRQLRREMQVGSSYLASEDPRSHFGLGSAEQVAKLHVTWPDGSETVRYNVAANQIITLSQ